MTVVATAAGILVAAVLLACAAVLVADVHAETKEKTR